MKVKDGDAILLLDIIGISDITTRVEGRRDAIFTAMRRDKANCQAKYNLLLYYSYHTIFLKTRMTTKKPNAIPYF